MSFFHTDAAPSARRRLILSLLPFFLLIVWYCGNSYIRYFDNPDDKIMPIPPKIVKGFERLAFKEDRRGDVRLWVDTVASGRRVGLALLIVSTGIIVGLNMGVFPYVDAVLHRFIVVFDKIPTMALLPILIAISGLGETTKIVIIVVGIFPKIVLEACLRVREIPREQFQKAKTLGASEFEIAYRIILPQILPRMLDAMRLNFGLAINLLFVSELLGAEAGLGYRVFLSRKKVAMDLIIPNVLWTAGILFLADWLMQRWIKRRYDWVDK